MKSAMSLITKSSIAILVAFVVLAFNASLVQAQYAISQPPSPQYFINKTVLDPRSNQYVDNLSVDQYQFLPGQDIWFRLEVKNTNQTELQNVVITDTLPKQVTFVTGDGTYNSANHTFTVNVGNMPVNSSKTYTLKAKIKNDAELSSMVTCPSNLAQATSNNNVQQDTASFCIQKKVLGVVQELPVTGPDATAVALGVSILGSLAGTGLLIASKRMRA